MSMAAQYEPLSRRNYSSVPLDDYESLEVLVRPSRNNGYSQVPNVIEVPISERDTLQGLSLKYRCTVSELKRINNISQDFELFARKTLKVPEKITLLESFELKAPEPLSSRSSSNASDLTDEQPTNSKKAKKLLEKFDRKVSRAKSKVNGYSESVPLLDNEEINISEIAEEISDELIVIERENKAFTYGIFRDILILFTVLGILASIFIIIADVRWNMTDHSWNVTDDHVGSSNISGHSWNSSDHIKVTQNMTAHAENPGNHHESEQLRR